MTRNRDLPLRARRWAILGLLALVGAPVPSVGAVAMAVNRLITMDATGTPIENCDGLITTLEGLEATREEPYLVRLEPGTYDCRPETLTLPPFVDLEGAGRGRTRVLVSGVGLRLTDNHELRHLTVVGGTFFTLGGVACAVFVNGEGAPRLTHVDLESDGGAVNCGLRLRDGTSPILTNVSIRIDRPVSPATDIGIDADRATASLEGVRIFVNGTTQFGGDPPSGYGIKISGESFSPLEWSIRNTVIEVKGHNEAFGISAESGGQLLVDGSEIRATGDDHGDALSNRATVVLLLRSALTGSSHAIHNDGGAPGLQGAAHLLIVNNSELAGPAGTIESHSAFSVLVGGSTLAGGGTDSGGGELTCAGVRDEDFTFSANSCP